MQNDNNITKKDEIIETTETLKPYSTDETLEEETSQEILSEEVTYEKYVVSIKRVAKVLKGGKKLSFSAMVIVGDKNGTVGYSLGKANDVPLAIEKGARKAQKNTIKIPIVGTTIPHQVIGKLGATRVLLKPAKKGTGIIAGLTVRCILEAAGVKDAITKVIGSTNPTNVVMATFDALKQLRTKEEILALRQQQ